MGRVPRRAGGPDEARSRPIAANRDPVESRLGLLQNMAASSNNMDASTVRLRWLAVGTPPVATGGAASRQAPPDRTWPCPAVLLAQIAVLLPRTSRHVGPRRQHPTDCCSWSTNQRSGSRGLMAPPATLRKSRPSAAEFCFDPVVSTGPISRRADACSLSAHSRSGCAFLEWLLARPKQVRQAFIASVARRRRPGVSWACPTSWRRRLAPPPRRRRSRDWIARRDRAPCGREGSTYPDRGDALWRREVVGWPLPAPDLLAP